MAGTIVVTCPDCKKQIKTPAELQGKKIRCKSCAHVFVVKADAPGQPAKDKQGGKPVRQTKAAAPADQPPAPAARKRTHVDDPDEGNPYEVTHEELGLRCPFCVADMEDGQIVCLECGYNIETRTRTPTTRTFENTGLDWFLHLLPGIVCVLVIIGLITWDVLYLMRAKVWFDGAEWYVAWLA